MTMKLLDCPDPVAVIRIMATEGSTPREPGTFMLVTAQAQDGTIGGGRLEYDAIQLARRTLQDGALRAQDVPLGPEIGQCCGGRVRYEVAFLDDAMRRTLRDDAAKALPQLHIFGGGHVGAALASVCAPLPLDVRLFDERPEFPGETLVPIEAAVASAAPASCYVVTTHDHATDFLIVEEVLKRADAAYLGMIGSKSKRAVLEGRLREAGLDPAPLVCPMGVAGLGDKRPEVIAACVAAEVIAAVGGR